MSKKTDLMDLCLDETGGGTVSTARCGDLHASGTAEACELGE